MRRPNICCAAALLLVAGLLCIFAKAQKHEPLTEVETIRLLQGGVPPERVAKVARESGIAFQVTPGVEQELKDAGASDRLVQTLRELDAAGRGKAKTESAKTDNPATGILLISADAPCKLNVDGDEAGTLAAGIPKRVSVPFGLPKPTPRRGDLWVESESPQFHHSVCRNPGLRWGLAQSERSSALSSGSSMLDRDQS